MVHKKDYSVSSIKNNQFNVKEPTVLGNQENSSNRDIGVTVKYYLTKTNKCFKL